jgi:hypothetical protein
MNVPNYIIHWKPFSKFSKHINNSKLLKSLAKQCDHHPVCSTWTIQWHGENFSSILGNKSFPPLLVGFNKVKVHRSSTFGTFNYCSCLCVTYSCLWPLLMEVILGLKLMEPTHYHPSSPTLNQMITCVKIHRYPNIASIRSNPINCTTPKHMIPRKKAPCSREFSWMWLCQMFELGKRMVKWTSKRNVCWRKGLKWIWKITKRN